MHYRTLASAENVDLLAESLLEIESDTPAQELAARYMLRMLDRKADLAHFYEENHVYLELAEIDAEVLDLLGLSLPKSTANFDLKSTFIARVWRKCCARREALEKKPIRSATLSASIEAFRDQLALSPIECELLAFLAVMHCVGWFRQLLKTTFGDIGTKRALHLLSRALRAERSEVVKILSSRSRLSQMGLIQWEEMTAELPEKLLCTPSLPRALLVDGANPDQFMLRQCKRAPETALSLGDFSYLERELSVITRLLQEACRRGTPGVNILLYGEPGTGKTELARVLAGAAQCSLWEVGCQDEEKDSVSAQDRLRFLRFAQKVLDQKAQSLLLFDEAEDVFYQDRFELFGLHTSNHKHGKAWFNQLLESNTVPTLWLSNRVHGFDSSHLRRFLYVMEVPRPPRDVRRSILQRELGTRGVPRQWLNQISADERLVPGHIDRAKRLIDHLGEITAEQAKDAAEQGLVNTLKATYQGRRLKGDQQALTRYEPQYLNTDTDLSPLIEGIARRGAGRLCFYGPPGTGKSAFARHLADQAGKALVYRRASDLLSMWVGGTEENIARMFEEADRENAAVLLDEADSFLASREGATRSWELTQVNELLTQMEAFEGLFMASTNLMGRLDFAALRRFDQKIYFDYLKPEQSRVLLLQVLKEHRIRPRKADQASLDRIGSLSNLTPGDFAAIIRRARLSPEAKKAQWWADALARECAAKPDKPSGSMGFI